MQIESLSWFQWLTIAGSLFLAAMGLTGRINDSIRIFRHGGLDFSHHVVYIIAFALPPIVSAVLFILFYLSDGLSGLSILLPVIAGGVLSVVLLINASVKKNNPTITEPFMEKIVRDKLKLGVMGQFYWRVISYTAALASVYFAMGKAMLGL